MRCKFFKREKGKVSRNLCMADVAIMGTAGDPYGPSDDEVFDYCVSEKDFRNCHRFQWVQREKDKAVLRSQY